MTTQNIQNGHTAQHAFASIHNHHIVTAVNQDQSTTTNSTHHRLNAFGSRHDAVNIGLIEPQDWWVDSGCSNHMTGTTDMLYHCRRPPVESDVTVGTGTQVAAETVATAILPTRQGDLHLQNVLHVP